jgi:hypothetical protein
MFSTRHHATTEYHPKGHWYVEASLKTFAFPIAISYQREKERTQFAVVLLFFTFSRVRNYRVTDTEKKLADG